MSVSLVTDMDTVPTGNADVIIAHHYCVANVRFHPSLLTSRAADVKVARHYSDTWSL
jgi:hypothetical protein